MRRTAALGVCVLLIGGCGGGSASVSRPSSPPTGAVSVRLIYRGEGTPQTPVVTSAALARAVYIMRRRLQALGVGAAKISMGPRSDEITVELPAIHDLARAEREVGLTARLEFYDWEANALTPKGNTVAILLQTKDPAALEISQGGNGGAGLPGSGGTPLYDAVKLASKQPSLVSRDNARGGSEYYMFGAPGSPTCATAARGQGKSPVAGVHCLLSGPAGNQQDLISALPSGVNRSQGQTIVIPPGTVVLQSTDLTAANPTSFNDPTAKFYVLKDHVALFGDDIINPQQSVDQSGNPDVTFGFTARGSSEFHQVTAEIAHRGELASGPRQAFDQHFTIALDNKLITVPYVDYKTYPDGLPGENGADIAGGFSIQSAQDLATQLRLGALPIRLILVSQTRQG